ncbi:MAG TPA: tRNA pseudouridine(38-40) synthase TruA [Saprospiraceae bacterium]|nr:tRNA pseudouridine(38-40) synthase TruA [Saprospiraceae bacterium]
MNRRYFIELAYNGKAYFGWQRQPEQKTVQETIEQALSTILNTPIQINGCGRTDTGVHAKQYYAHFNYTGAFPEGFLRRLNKFLPKDIAIFQLFQVHWDAHTRFDAYHRSYEYHLDFVKNPFAITTAYQYSYPIWPDFEKMQQAAGLLLHYEEFFPFCKSNHNAKTLRCELRRSEWVYHEEETKLVFHISANRFLRGMVRLIVGMCINVGLDKVRLEEVKKAMDRQKRLRKSSSAPPEGLFLTDIRYPYLENRAYIGDLKYPLEEE